MAPVVFKNVSRSRLDELRGEARTKVGLYLVGDSGNADISTPLGKLSFTYGYSEPDKTLTVTCTKKPFLVPESKVRSTLQEIVGA